EPRTRVTLDGVGTVLLTGLVERDAVACTELVEDRRIQRERTRAPAGIDADRVPALVLARIGVCVSRAGRARRVVLHLIRRSGSDVTAERTGTWTAARTALVRAGRVDVR